LLDTHLTIAFGYWAKAIFAPQINGYCDILLTRIDPIFEDVDGEQERAGRDYMTAAASWYGDDEQGAAEAAYEHAVESAMQFIEMRAAFMAVGVSGLFHLLEKQLYRHLNNELRYWLKSPLTQWSHLNDIIPKFENKMG